jgi:HK97 family phage portal protein
MIFDKFINMFKTKAIRYLFNTSYGTPKWSITNDEKYIREAFEKIVWVYSCVTMISSAVANVEWCLYNKVNGEVEEIESHRILDLLNNEVNPNMSSRDFFDLWATYLALNGKFFAVFDSPINPTIIEPLITYFVKPIPDLQDFISGVNYDINGISTDYSKNLVLWSKFNDPLDLYEGLSPIKALARVLDTENSAIDWNKTSLDNSGVPPGALVVESPTEAQIKGIREKWKENYAGKQNVRMPLILDSEKAKYIPFGMTQIEMDFILQRKVNRIEICSAFGVPGQVVGDPEGQTYSNYNEALEAFWKNTVIPRYLNHIKSVLNLSLKSKFLGTENMYVDYDLDDVEVLSENQNEITDRVLNMYNNDFITLNEGRERLGWGRLEYGDELKSKIMTILLAGDSGDLQSNEMTMTEMTATVSTSTVMATNTESSMVVGD